MILVFNSLSFRLLLTCMAPFNHDFPIGICQALTRICHQKPEAKAPRRSARHVVQRGLEAEHVAVDSASEACRLVQEEDGSDTVLGSAAFYDGQLTELHLAVLGSVPGAD